MIKFSALLTALTASSLAAQAPTVDISIAIRETGAAGGTFTAVGDDGGFSGGIEWINRDGIQIPLDGTWQLVTFDFANDPITGFAGATANNILDGDFGTIEHIRVLNSSGYAGTIEITLDDINNTWTDTNGRQQSVTFGDFENYAEGDEVMFQEPSFSGSTAGGVAAGSTSGVDNFVASRNSGGYAMRWAFIDNTPTRWVRLTTFQASNQPNPLVRFDGGSTLSFWVRGGVKQDTVGTPANGNVIAETFGEGLNAGQTSTFYAAGAMPNAPGALALSFAGGTDVPLLGGTLYSFGSLIAAIPVTADASGAFSLPILGDATMANAVLQAVFVDSTGGSLTVQFSNAVDNALGI